MQADHDLNDPRVVLALAPRPATRSPLRPVLDQAVLQISTDLPQARPCHARICRTTRPAHDLSHTSHRHRTRLSSIRPQMAAPEHQTRPDVTPLTAAEARRVVFLRWQCRCRLAGLAVTPRHVVIDTKCERVRIPPRPVVLRPIARWKSPCLFVLHNAALNGAQLRSTALKSP